MLKYPCVSLLLSRMGGYSYANVMFAVLYSVQSIRYGERVLLGLEAVCWRRIVAARTTHAATTPRWSADCSGGPDRSLPRPLADPDKETSTIRLFRQVRRKRIAVSKRGTKPAGECSVAGSRPIISRR
jgi:hypothetical protein